MDFIKLLAKNLSAWCVEFRNFTYIATIGSWHEGSVLHALLFVGFVVTCLYI